MRMERDSAWGDGRVMFYCAGVLLNRTLEPCMVLQAEVTPIHSIKKFPAGLRISYMDRSQRAHQKHHGLLPSVMFCP